MNEGEERAGYWTTPQATANGWWPGLLYRLRKRDLIRAYKFERDNKNYWKIDELEKVKTLPPAVRLPPTRQ